METLPVIANPVSPWKHVTGKKAWSRYSASTNRAEDIAFLTRLHRYGIRDLVINEHEGCMRDDGESFTFRDKSAPKKGGDKAWRKYADYLINTLGYYYGPYNNFTDFPPVNANWRFDRVARRTVETDGPDAGGFVTAWTRCYNPKTAFGYASCVYYAVRLKEKYGFNTAYCDVHTSKPPWSYVDYDACVPGAGTFQTTYRAYAAILLEQKKAWGGPVYSEGDCQFFYAGLSDGNYAQPGIHPDKNPWIVDFNLKRIHPLECDFGMGNPNMFNVDKLPTDYNPSPADPQRPAINRGLEIWRGTNCWDNGVWPHCGEDGFLTRFTSRVTLPAKLTGYVFDLPTIAQWQYACRAGTIGAWNNGTTITNVTEDANLDLLARYKKNPKVGYHMSHPVGCFLPNAFGLYDMHGNVHEMARDKAYGSQFAKWYTNAPAVDPLESGDPWPYVPACGGYWNDPAGECRSANIGSAGGKNLTGSDAAAIRIALVYED